MHCIAVGDVEVCVRESVHIVVIAEIMRQARSDESPRSSDCNSTFLSLHSRRFIIR